MSGDRLRVFVSSKMAELAAERAAIKEVLDELRIDAWVFEQDAGARPETIEETYKEQLRAADLYIGVFWKGYGEYTIDEFELALDTNTDCLVYQKEGDKAEGRDPRLAAFLNRIGTVEKGLTAQFFNTPEELREMVQRDTARWQTRIVRKYRDGGSRRGAGAADPNLVVLRNKVKQAWVEGVLARSSGETGLVELAKESRPEAVEPPRASPGALGSGLGTAGERALDPGTSITEIFDREKGSLLILGSSGSGKTTTALELVRDLLVRAERDGSRPVPVVLNLSAWSHPTRTLLGWITQELVSKYHVPERISRPWLEHDRLVLVLDGLDEVEASQRAACADAINRFGREYGADGLVVTSRIEEYEALGLRLAVNGAVCLQPLGAPQVDAFLERAGEHLAGLRVALETDEELRELARSPLMLSVMSLAYRDRRPDELEEGELARSETRTENLLRTYVERAFVEHETGRPYSRDATTSWLSWLGRRMSRRSRTLFLIEDLQPDWLATRRHRGTYLFGLAALLGLVLGGLCILYRMTPSAIVGGALAYERPQAAEMVGWLVTCALFALGIGLTDGARFGDRDSEVRGARQAVLRTLANLALFSMLWVPILSAKILLWAGAHDLGWQELWNRVTSALFDPRAAVELYPTSVVRFVVPALGLTVGAAALAARRSLTRSIHTTESLQLERASAIRGALLGLLAGAIFTAIVFALSQGHWAAFFWLPAGGATGAVLAGFKPRIVRGKAMPNQGIRLTIKSSLRAARMAVPLAMIVPAFCLLAVAAGEPGYGAPPLIVQWSVTAVVFLFVCLALWFGGLDAGKHYLLRATIGATRQGPWDFQRLLGYACRLKLTQRVGGGYMFLNRQLLDHFANLNLPPPEAEEVSAQEHEDRGAKPVMVAVGAVALSGGVLLYAGLVARIAPATVLGSTLLSLSALWLVIHTAVRSALRASRKEDDES